MDPDGDVIHVDSDHDDSDDEEAVSLSDCGDGLFGAPQQVFIVRALSKAMTGFRPSVMCEGFLAELSKSSSGYILAPLGREQQLSFKYEPPSPKFSRKRPSCVSYRLQLLHGSQFLYSLRGLPKVLRCQRSAHALEWGPVHLVFASAADLDKFLATMKYVDVEEMAPGQPGAPGAVGEQPRHSSGLVAVSAESSTHGDDGAGGNGAREGSSGGGMQWAVAAARLLAAEVDCAEGNAGDEPTATAGGRPSEEIPAGAPPLDFFSWLRSEVLLGTPFLAATAGAVVLVATVAAVLVSGKFRRGAGHSGKGV
ncbi:hypothetical protein Vretifemale_20598 [Volvox reticuliferus]|uniref:Uncharacterized protein n=1 Tax=Volvox reticuliferus TaxID=1737510 RepID=A0A8J4D0Y0_9CHLO|nr:hypothetical protein Vretifemale_20598 [Volvox reticuliferus]